MAENSPIVRSITERTQITIGLVVALVLGVLWLADLKEKLGVAVQSIVEGKEVQLRIITKIQSIDNRMDTMNTSIGEIRGELKRIGDGGSYTKRKKAEPRIARAPSTDEQERKRE